MSLAASARCLGGRARRGAAGRPEREPRSRQGQRSSRCGPSARAGPPRQRPDDRTATPDHDRGTSRPARAGPARQDLTGRDLAGADLTGADLTDTVLESADLRRTNLTGAKLIRARLDQAILSGAILDQADLRDARLLGADLRSAAWQGLRSARRATTTGAQADQRALTAFTTADATLPDQAAEPQYADGFGGTSFGTHLSFDPDGDVIAVACGTAVRIWSVATGLPVRTLAGRGPR